MRAGEYLVLLNNDVVVTDGWLDQLIALANMRNRSEDDVAAHAEFTPPVPPFKGSAVRVLLLFAAGTADTISTLYELRCVLLRSSWSWMTSRFPHRFWKDSPWPTGCGACFITSWTTRGWTTSGSAIEDAVTSRTSSSAPWPVWLPTRCWSTTAVAARPSSGRRKQGHCRSRSVRPTRNSETCPCPSARQCSGRAPRGCMSCCRWIRPSIHFPLPRCWDGFEVFGADGKAIKHVKRLLKPLRGLQAGILGARASVALNLRTGTAFGMVGHLDGEAGEAALTEELLPKMAAAAAGKPWLAVLDRLYCNLRFPRRVLLAGGHFLIRYCSNTAFVADPARAGPGEPRCTGPANCARMGAVGQDRGRSGALRAPDHPAPG